MASATEYIQGNVIDGKAVAAQIRREIKEEVSNLRERYGKVPGLAVVIVGERKDSQTYVRMKKKGCEEVGIKSFSLELPATVTQKQLVREVQRFNRNPDVHGILVQLPLPDHIDERVVLEEISIEKDVDGFHPLNIANLAMKGREPLFLPCTPLGCMELLDRCGVVLRGKRAVVLGRSNIVGLPVAMLLNNAHATVTIVHSRTKDVEAVVREADVIIAAIGRAEFVKAGWVKPGAVIIDVGINPVDDASRKSGYRLVGDAEYEGCKQVAGAITPVPGGVGPMTIAMLLRNTLRSGARAIASSHKRQGLWPAAQDLPSWPAVAAAGVLAGLVLQRVFARSR